MVKRLIFLGVVVVSVALVGSGSIGGVIPGWRVSQECTPIAPGDTSGSVGSASVDAQANSTSVFSVDNDFTLTDDTSGTFLGNVSASPVTGGSVHLDVSGKLNFLVADRTVDPVWFDAESPVNFVTTGDGTGQVTNLYKVAVDPFDGSVFVSSYGLVTTGRYVIIKYSASGNYITEFGSYGSSAGQLGGANSIAVNPLDGSVIVGDGINNRIQIFTTSGPRTTYTYSSQVGSLGTGNGQFGFGVIPVAVDSSGNVYAGDRGNARIQKFNSSLVYQAQVAVPGFHPSQPIYDISVSPSDVIYVSLIPTTLTTGSAGIVRRYTTALVASPDIIPTVPPGTSSILNIAATSDGFWAYWGRGNLLVKYGDDGIEKYRWYSGYPFVEDINTGYTPAIGLNGRVVVGFKSVAGIVPVYADNRVTSFKWTPALLSDVIESYMRECESNLTGLTYSYDATSDPHVILPAWSGDVWTKLKEICTAHGIEIYLDEDTIHVDDVGSRTITFDNNTPLRVEPVSLFGGREIVITAQHPTAGGGTVFDAGLANTRYQIDVGQRKTVYASTTNYPVTVDPLVPTSVLPVLPGQYYVLDNAGLNVTPSAWVAAGASVTAFITNVPGQIGFILQGPNTAISGFSGPFTFADSLATTGSPALTLTGTGVFTNPEEITFQTGANESKVTQQTARTIRNIAIDTLDRLYQRAPLAIDEVSGFNTTVSFQMPTSDLLGFGATLGAVVTAQGSKWRITKVSFGVLTADITAVSFNSIDDIDTATTGLTIDQRDAIWTGYSIDDRSVKPIALTL